MSDRVGENFRSYRLWVDYNLSELISLRERGVAIEYLFFWGHQPRPDGAVSKACFSQWFVAPFEVDGEIYPTAEHWMMASKARLFGDVAILDQILAAPKPIQAKSLGRKVSGFDTQVWSERSFEIVVRGNLAKFEQNQSLRDFLLATDDKVLVEASPDDRIWGIGLAQDDIRSSDCMSWIGENRLGFALMKVRDYLRGREDDA